MVVPHDTPAIAEDRRDTVDFLVRSVGIALVAAVLGYYITSAAPQIRLNPFGPTITLHMVTAAVVLIYVSYLALYRRLPGGTPIDWAVALLVIAYALATAASINWRVSFESMLQVFMAMVVFYSLSDIRILSARDVQRGLMLAGAGASFYALWVVAGDYADWLSLARSVGDFSLGDLIPPTVPRVHDVSDHPNILAMVLVLIVPFYALAIYRPEVWWERVAAAVGLVAAILAIFLTLSRGAWVGSAVGLAVAAAGVAVLALRGRAVSFSPATSLQWLRRNRTGAILAGIAFAVVLVAAAVAAANLWGSRPQWLFRNSISSREDVFAAGFDMFKDYPLLGVGPDTYALLYPEYSGEFPVHGVHAHNAYLQAAVDLGLPGLAALLVVGAVLGWMTWRTVRDGTLAQQLLAVAALGALAGFLTHSLVDAPNTWKASLVALAAVGAVVVGNYREVIGPGDADAAGGGTPPTPVALRLRRFLPLAPRLVVLAVIVALLAGWGWVDAAHFYYSRGVTRAVGNRLPEAVADASKAVDLDPQFAIYQLQLGLTEVRLYGLNGDASLLEDAIRHLQRGVELEPRSAIGNVNLARALGMAGRDEEARAAALEARRLAGIDEAVVLAAGTVFEDLGETDEAIESYASAISLNVELADSPFWVSSPFRQEHYGDIVSHSALALNPCRFGSVLVRSESGLMAIAGADLEDLAGRCANQAAAAPNDVGRRVSLGEMLLELGDVTAAGEHLRFAVQRQPDNGRARTGLGRWYAEREDLDAARQEWLLASQLEDPEGVLLLGGTYEPGQIPENLIKKLGELLPEAASDVQNDLISVLYYRMKFGRGAPVVMIVPGDWQQAVPGQYARIQQALLRWRAGAPAASGGTAR